MFVNLPYYLRAFKYALCPIFISLYPVLFLYAFNIEMLSLRQTYTPVIFAVIMALIVFILSSLLMKSMLNGSLFAVFFLIVFWNYDLFYHGLYYLLDIRQRHALIIMAVSLGLLFFLVYRTAKKERLEIINTVIFVIVIFLVIINLVTILPKEFQKQKALSAVSEYEEVSEYNQENENLPDVYLLIFDEYARLDTIKKEWGYDNIDLKNELEDIGFFLADKSEVKHKGTIYTMPELLNLEYYDSEKNDAQLISLYYNNLLFSYFNNRGYEIFFLDGYDHPLRRGHPAYVNRLVYTDMQREKDSLLTDSFVALLFSRSLLNPFEHLLGLNQPGKLYYEGNLGFINYIKNIFPYKEGPLFVFAHINSPHLPYVFDRAGNLTNHQIHFFQYQDFSAEELKEMYLDQYIFITKVIKDIARSIKENSSNDVIIIFQSDHGPRPSSAGNEDENEAYKVLNAVYFPDENYSNFAKDMSPVNTMRMVLNQFFEEDFEMVD